MSYRSFPVHTGSAKIYDLVGAFLLRGRGGPVTKRNEAEND